MKKILIALLMTPLLMAPILSFSVLAVDTPLTSTSIPDNAPTGGDTKCPQGVGACGAHH